ncbi:hypothetical protein D3C85_1661510 [compost metagenome]
MTAALPKSLARFDRLCRSSEMRSTAASTLEFSNSTISTSSSVPSSKIRSTAEIGSRNAQGVKITTSVSSCRNALSSSTA